MKKQDFSYYLMNFLSRYLPNEKGYSKNTVSSYCQCFILLFDYFKELKKITSHKVTLSHLTKTEIVEFLAWIEENRGCSISTRNQRLSALNSFFQYVSDQTPEYLFQYSQLQSIKTKKAPKPIIEYLEKDEVQILLSSPNQSSALGFRDMVLLSVMYDSAARVQEICDLIPRDIDLDQLKIRLTGKGQKTRIIPIMRKTANLLEKYIKDNFSDGQNAPLFPNRNKQKMTRAGVAYILDKYLALAAKHNPSRFNGNIHPHCIRHTRAMHMLDSGLPIHYIRDFLGHESIATTEVYARASQDSLKKALEKTLNYDVVPECSWKTNSNTLTWLRTFNK